MTNGERKMSVLNVCLWDKPMNEWALICGAGFTGSGKSDKARKVIASLLYEKLIEQTANDDDGMKTFRITEAGKQAWSAA